MEVASGSLQNWKPPSFKGNCDKNFLQNKIWNHLLEAKAKVAIKLEIENVEGQFHWKRAVTVLYQPLIFLLGDYFWKQE